MTDLDQGLKRYDLSTGKKPNFKSGGRANTAMAAYHEAKDIQSDVDSGSDIEEQDPLEGLSGLELSVKRWDLEREKAGKDRWRPNKNANKNSLNEKVG